mmetsp:Transcript_40510/g.56287  ORF Transcript_40510/g.56287 Transcript_40510/m.56287 type:complete len:82 (+) Transcript_40510:88-333(+)
MMIYYFDPTLSLSTLCSQGKSQMVVTTIGIVFFFFFFKSSSNLFQNFSFFLFRTVTVFGHIVVSTRPLPLFRFSLKKICND